MYVSHMYNTYCINLHSSALHTSPITYHRSLFHPSPFTYHTSLIHFTYHLTFNPHIFIYHIPPTPHPHPLTFHRPLLTPHPSPPHSSPPQSSLFTLTYYKQAVCITLCI